MSAHYKMVMKVYNYDSDKAEQIAAAVEDTFHFEDYQQYRENNQPRMIIVGDDNLSGGENELASELAKAVWEANGKYCLVEVELSNLDAVPHNTYIRDEVAYAG